MSCTASWAAENGHLHILEYLVERKYDKYNEVRRVMLCGQERPLRLFEVLTRNRQSALGRGAYEKRTRTTTPNVYNTSSITTALYHGIGDTNAESYAYQNNKIAF